MRIFMLSVMMFVLVGCVAQKPNTSTVLHGNDAAVAAAANLPSSEVDVSNLKDESYHDSHLPWLVDNVTKTVVVKDIYRAIYHPQEKELQVEYTEHGKNTIDYYHIGNILLMTPNGPCVITDETFTCPE